MDVFAAHNFRGIGYHLFGQSDFTGYLYGERASGISYLQLEECAHLVAVVEHGSIDYAFVVFGKVLQVLVMGGDDPECLFLVKPFQYRFGNGASDLRLRTSAELVYQDKALAVAIFHHILHIGKV